MNRAALRVVRGFAEYASCRTRHITDAPSTGADLAKGCDLEEYDLSDQEYLGGEKALAVMAKGQASHPKPTKRKPRGSRPADVFVAFGITGDLAKVMTFNSLYRLEARGLIE